MLSCILKFLFIITAILSQSGCFLTKVVTVPMRVGGAVVSIVPGIGETAHSAIDQVAETVDDLPL